MPYGQIQVDTVKDSFNNTFAPASSRFTNRIINGAMTISQYNGTSSVTPTGAAYLVDRWQVIPSQSSKLSFQQNAGSVTPPVGFTNYLGATSLSNYALLAGDYFLLTQKIEGFNSADLGWGTANAKTVTVSFWVRSSLTGTFGFILRNGAGNRVYPASYTISSANTWEFKTVTVAGDTTGTWSTDNSIGLELDFGLGVASNISNTAGAWTTGGLGTTGATSVVGTNGATFYITGVQLEVGSNATSFEYRPINTELAMCQRYYEKSYNRNTVPGTVATGGCTQIEGAAATTMFTGIFFKTTKRADPTVTLYSTNNGASGQIEINGATNIAGSVQHASEQGFTGGGTNGSSFVWIRIQYTASAEL